MNNKNNLSKNYIALPLVLDEHGDPVVNRSKFQDIILQNLDLGFSYRITIIFNNKPFKPEIYGNNNYILFNFNFKDTFTFFNNKIVDYDYNAHVNYFASIADPEQYEQEKRNYYLPYKAIEDIADYCFETNKDYLSWYASPDHNVKQLISNLRGELDSIIGASTMFYGSEFNSKDPNFESFMKNLKIEFFKSDF